MGGLRPYLISVAKAGSKSRRAIIRAASPGQKLAHSLFMNREQRQYLNRGEFMQPTWDDIVRMRNKREDEPVQKRFAPFSHLGRGHLFPHLCGRMVQDA